MSISKNKKTKIFFQRVNKQGSVLAFTLTVMFIFLIIAIGIANVSIKEIKTSSDTGKSIIAYQVADSGVEVVLEKILTDGCSSVDDLVNIGGMSCDDTSGVAIISDSAPSGEYDLTFEDNTDLDITACDDNVNNIARIKSLGKYSGTNRAVEVSL